MNEATLRRPASTLQWYVLLTALILLGWLLRDFGLVNAEGGIGYWLGIIGGSLLSLILHRNHEYRALGASGGVCGIIFACIFLLPGSSVYMFPFPFAIPAHIFAILFIVGSYIGLRGRLGNIGHDAHLGGAIVSLLVTTAMYPYIIRENPILYPGVLVMAVAILLLLYINPLHLPQAATRFKMHMPEKKKQKKEESKIDEEPTDEEVLNQLLEKVSKSSIHSLNYVERQKLEMITKRKKQQNVSE